MPRIKMVSSGDLDQFLEASLKARTAQDSFWSSLSVLGVVGWSVVLPTLLGVALGIFLDRRWPGRVSWAITLLFAGLVLGCVNAWVHLRGNHR